MKNLRYFIHCMFLLLVGACEHSVERTYVIENQSNHSLEVKFFRSDILTSKIVLNDGDKWETLYSEDMATGVDAARALHADSLTVTFDNMRILYYSFPTTGNRNLLSNDSYIIESDELYRYIFTEQDYENAEEIAGGG